MKLRLSLKSSGNKQAAKIPDLSKPLPKKLLEDALNKILRKMKAGFGEVDGGIKLEYPRDKAHGDYASGIALKLAKIEQKNPMEVAKIIQQNLPGLSFLDSTEIAAPGFINFYLSKTWLEAELQKNLKLKQHYGKMAYGVGKKVVVEYSSPNIAKPLGAQHLLSTLIGHTIANILHFCGYKIIKLNYLGDWGTQFGKLIHAYKTWGDHKTIERDPLNELLKLYVRFHGEAEKDPALEEKGRQEFKKMEDGNEQNLHLWRWIREESLKALEKIYRRLGVRFDECLGESLYNEAARAIIKEGKTKGIFTEGEKGALVVEFEDDKYPPYLIQKGDGATLYSTRDLASIRDRLQRYKPERLIYVVDAAQSLHFQQLFATAKKLGINNAELVHVAFGRMLLPEGKMSTRKGTAVLLDDLLRESIERARKIVENKNSDLSAAEKEFIMENIAVGAIKYHIVSQNRETNLVFDLDRMLSLEGNSAPYLQYSYARAKSILRKGQNASASEVKNIKNVEQARPSGLKADKLSDVAAGNAQNNTKANLWTLESALLHALVKFPEHVQLAAETYKPNLLTNYLHELAQIFNSFYQEVPVLNSPTPKLKSARLNLVKSFAQVIKNGLELLGIQTFEKM